MKYIFLTLAIIFELVGTSFLKKSENFSKIIPSIVTVVAFAFCYYFFSHAIKTIPLGVAYAIWAGVGIIVTALISVFIFKQPIDLAAIIGIILIVSGVVVINLFSNTSTE